MFPNLTFSSPTALLQAPGDVIRSVLRQRMARRDANGMPPLASNLTDTAGIALIDAWIGSLMTSDCQ